MATAGKRLIPVELLRRSCRRRAPKSEEPAITETISIKKEPSEPKEARGDPLENHHRTVEKKLKSHDKVEVKQESLITEFDCNDLPEQKYESPSKPDGFLEVDQDELDLERTLMGGQSFRWKMSINESEDHKSTTSDMKQQPLVFTGVVGNHVMQLWRCDQNRVAYRQLIKINAQQQTKPGVEEFLADYFQLQHKLKDLYEKWSIKDEHFKRCSVNYRGFRILRQDPVENLFSFICATNNNIKRISLMIDKMCQQFGDRLEMNSGNQHTTATFHSFPSVERLAREDVFDSLRYKLGFGYRAKFICETAKKLMTMSSSSEAQTTPREYLLHLRQLPYRETCKRLQEFPGIGRKVADCICLMSMDHLESVPIDCHIYEIVCRNYMKTLRQERKTLTESVHDLIGDYFTKLHGPLAGWATSVLFIGELKHLKQETSSERGQSGPGGKKAPNKKQKKS